MKKLSSFALLLPLLGGCAQLATLLPQGNPESRVAVNVPALSGELQAARSAGDLRAVESRLSLPLKLSLGRALETYVPAEYQVYTEPGLDLGQTVAYDRSRAWPQAMARAVSAAGLVIQLDGERKTIRLHAANGAGSVKNATSGADYAINSY